MRKRTVNIFSTLFFNVMRLAGRPPEVKEIPEPVQKKILTSFDPEEKTPYQVRTRGLREIPFNWKKLIKSMDITKWPKAPVVTDWDYPGTNMVMFTFLGRRTGLSYCRDNGSISVSLDHPMKDFWLKIVEPLWEKRRKGVCQTCHGTGWDGIGYIYGCGDCNSTGKAPE